MFPDGDLIRMQATQSNHMPDICHRSVFSTVRDEYGAEKEVYTENTTDIPCGINQAISKSENVKTNMTVINYDAVARLAIDQIEIWSVKDRLILTKRFGRTLSTPIIYGIAAPIRSGPSGLQFNLQKIEI